MRSRYIYKIICSLLLISGLARAQSIRKNYREFTQQEMNDYVAALNVLWTSGTWANFYNAHQMHFSTPIHTTGGNDGEQFLPWHRFFLLDMELRIRAANANYTYLSIPYWDWRTDQNPAAANSWHTGFLSLSNFSTWGLSRPFPGSTYPNSSTIATVMAASTFFTSTVNKGTATDFSHMLELQHDFVHSNIGGTMGQQTSPRDPVFYLHHNMVDKLWQEREDAVVGIQSSFPNGTTGMHHYSPPDYPITVTLNAMRDSRNITRPTFAGSGRNMDVWFAENGKVLLDGANNAAFVCSDASVSYIYRYVAATSPGATTFNGDMFVGDVQRDGSGNVIADNKGGFEINSGAKANFLAGREITFSNGFWAKNGSEMVAKIITTANQAAPLQMAGAPGAPIVTLINTDKSDQGKAPSIIRVFPNPATSKAFIQYSVKTTATVYLVVTDISGRTISITAPKKLEPGNYVEEVNMTDLPNGVYMFNLQIGNQKNAFKIVK